MSDMESIFVQLRKARESKSLSIADVASATMINSDLLRAIENGRTDMLPQAYVRAFLREYAEVVGLNPAEVMQQYEGRKASTAPPETSNRPAEAVPESPLHPRQEPAPPPHHPSRRHFTYVAVIAGCVLAGIIYWNLSRPRPLSDVIQTTQTGVQPTPPSVPDDDRPQVPSVRTDSLTLIAMTKDTVWVRIVVDRVDTLEYLMRPNTRRSWKAKMDFSVSVGRPEAIEFTLNGRRIGRLGRAGGIIVDRKISRRTLDESTEAD